MTTLQDANRNIAQCRACPLAQGRTNTVPGEGPSDARIAIIGEGPGRQEDLSGRPFTGPAGKLLDQLLAENDIDRRSVFITNVVKCRPPGNATPDDNAINACRHHLEQQQDIVKPTLIVAAGKPAAQWFWPDRPIRRLNDYAGRLYQTPDHRFVMPILHPAAGLRNEGTKSLTTKHCRQIPGLLAMLTATQGE